MQADEYVESPAEIVARLHARIARKSPELAALVIAFEALPRPPRRPLLAPRPPAAAWSEREWRMSAYTAARLAGASEKAAATRAGIRWTSTWQYEADMLGVLGGAVS